MLKSQTRHSAQDEALAKYQVARMWRLIVTFPAIILVTATAVIDIWRPEVLSALVLIPPWCWVIAGGRL